MLLASIRKQTRPQAAFKYRIGLSRTVFTPACRQIRENPQGLTPGRDRCPTFERLGDPQPRAFGRLRRQRIHREETAGYDLAVRLGQPVLPELPDQIDRDVVAPEDVAVQEH